MKKQKKLLKNRPRLKTVKRKMRIEMIANCPECSCRFNLDQPPPKRVGSEIVCPACHATMVVTSLDLPVLVKKGFDEQTDSQGTPIRETTNADPEEAPDSEEPARSRWAVRWVVRYNLGLALKHLELAMGAIGSGDLHKELKDCYATLDRIHYDD